MKRIVFSVLTAGLIALAGAAVADSKTDKPYVSAVGEYNWNPKTSHYSTPVYATVQTMSIKRDDPKTGINVSQDVTLADGKKLDWSYDGPYDGKLQKREWMSFAFKRIKPDAFSNDYIMSDGTKGHEVATVSKDNITIRGSSWGKDGKKQPYVEVWDKVP